MSGKEITGFRPGSKSWKNFMAKLYGIGAAVVILGALFKIMHWPGAGPMLVVGLTTEAFIFLFSAFEPLHEEPDWTLVYPELSVVEDIHEDDELTDEMDEIDEHMDMEVPAAEVDDRPLTEQLDEMLEEAKIGPELIESLGSGLRGLGDQASKLNDITDASVATEEFANSLKGASQSANELQSSYVKASESLTSISISPENSETYNTEMQKITKNLSELNSVYELQLTGTNNNLEATNKLYTGIEELMQNLTDSIDDTRKYKSNMAALSENLAALTTVYGNMLGAMQVTAPPAQRQVQPQNEEA